MRSVLFILALLFTGYAGAQRQWQLATPLMRAHSNFFQYKMQLNMKFGHPEAVIRYTLNGTEPTAQSKSYKRPLIINKNQTVKAKAFAPGFRASETVTMQFYKRGYALPVVTGTAPDPAYPGTGLAGLTDMMAGMTDLHFKTWLGYQCDTITYDMEMNRPVKLQHLMLDFLQQRGAWIYLPQAVLVSVWNDATGQYELKVQHTRSAVTADEGIVTSIIDFPPDMKGKKLRIQIVPLHKIPAGLPGENEKGWLFIDEINLN